MVVSEFGFSPYELLFGRKPRGPLTLLFDNWWVSGGTKASQPVVDYLSELQDRLKHVLSIAHKHQENELTEKSYYDKKSRDVCYNIGDKVFVLTTVSIRPLDHKYQGPYEIIDKLSPVNYLLRFHDKKKLDRNIHVKLI